MSIIYAHNIVIRITFSHECQQSRSKTSSSGLITSALSGSPEARSKPLEISSAELITSTRVVGRGSYAVVYYGTYEGRAIAIKSFKDKKWCDEELQLCWRLASRYTLNLIGYTVNPPCLVTEYMANSSLDNYLAKVKLTSQQVMSLSSNMLYGLKYLHDKAYVHRDVRSGNMLLNQNSDVVICDFGSLAIVGSPITRFYGTPVYMAPEILDKSAKTVSTKEDIFSLGLVIFELLVGKDFNRTFRCRDEFEALALQKSGKRLEIISKIVKDKNVQGLCPDVIADLIMWCLQENPDNRPSIAEIMEFLEKSHYWIEKWLFQIFEALLKDNNVLFQLEPGIKLLLSLYVMAPDDLKKKLIEMINFAWDHSSAAGKDIILNLVMKIIPLVDDKELRSQLIGKYSLTVELDGEKSSWLKDAMNQYYFALDVINQAFFHAESYRANPSNEGLLSIIGFYRLYRAKKTQELTCLEAASIELIDEYAMGPGIK